MNADFSRTLALLRQEKEISQRKAAADLGISQALLSHYENGVREPGLAFVKKACDYYHVSADYLLGRTLDRDGGKDLDAFHLSIIAADRAHADVVVEHDGDARLAEGVEITTGKDSHISTTFIQEWNKDSKHVGNQRIHVGEEASLRHSVVTLGGDVVRIRMDQDFGGEQGDLNMLGIYFVDPDEHIEHRTMVVHNHPECKSRVVYKGALDGKGAHSTWVGNALIEPTAPGTDSYELNRNLVLTPGAIADSEPNLEIENGNIIGAGHASSVGRFDDEELFYLESRGISENEARKLVVRGFFGELVEEIGIPAISEHLMNVIDKRLARGESDAIAQVLEEK